MHGPLKFDPLSVCGSVNKVENMSHHIGYLYKKISWQIAQKKNTKSIGVFVYNVLITNDASFTCTVLLLSIMSVERIVSDVVLSDSNGWSTWSLVIEIRLNSDWSEEQFSNHQDDDISAISYRLLRRIGKHRVMHDLCTSTNPTRPDPTRPCLSITVLSHGVLD